MDAALTLGTTALALGSRHAFDPDHIAAIDNVTRRLSGVGRRPLGVGLYFSLGHATVVFALCLLIGLGVHGLGNSVRGEGSELHRVGGVVGPLISGVFLLAVGALNLRALGGIAARARRLRGGGDDGATSAAPPPGGPLSRVFSRVIGAVREPWHMYPVGLLFGLGFDTATEVTLLVLAGGAGAAGAPLPALLSLPLLFAVGMVFFDGLDGILMAFAYGWAIRRPGRRAGYNLALTGLSATLALTIGAVELASALSAPTL
jgi:nickel/cobalt transporter (NiCoT) family protein